MNHQRRFGRSPDAAQHAALTAWCAADPGSTLRALRWVPALRSSVKHAAPRPGHERKLLSPQSSDLPDGRFIESCVQPTLQKYFCFRTPQITSRTFVSHPTEGRFMIVTNAGRDAVDAAAFCAQWDRRAGSQESVSDQQHADERCCCGRQNRVVLTPRRWRQVRGVLLAQPGSDKTISADNGGKRARSPGR